MALTEEQRAAQRSLVGLTRRGVGVRLSREDGLCVFRDTLESEFALGAAELAEHLDALDIPYAVVVGAKMQRGKRLIEGFDVRVAWDDLATLTRWVPSLQEHIDAVAAEPL